MGNKLERNEMILKHHRNGMSNVAIAKMIGISRGAVAGVILRGRGDEGLSVQERHAKIRRFHDKGLRPIEIGREMGMHYMKVVYVLKHLGLIGAQSPSAWGPRDKSGPISGLYDRGVKKAPDDFDWGRGFGGNDVKSESYGAIRRAGTHVPTASSADLAARG